MSNFLCGMKEGEEVSLQGPFGDFILRPPMRDTIFIATGTGIAPFRSMLQWLFADEAQHQGKQLWLLFGNRYERDIYYHDEFMRLAGRHSNFHYSPTLSRPDEDGKACAAMCSSTFRKLLKAGPMCTPTSVGSTKWSKPIASC